MDPSLFGLVLVNWLTQLRCVMNLSKLNEFYQCTMELVQEHVLDIELFADLAEADMTWPMLEPLS